MEQAPRVPGERHLTLWSYFWTALTRRYGSFDGRSRRLEFWSYYLFIVLFYLLILAAQALLDGVDVTKAALITPFGIEGILSGYGDRPYFDAPMLVWVIRLLSVVLFVPTLAVSCRRYHDVGLPAWLFWILRGTMLAWAVVVSLKYGAQDFGSSLFRVLSIVVGVVALADLVIHLLPGQKGTNKYGPDPRQSLPPQEVEVLQKK